MPEGRTLPLPSGRAPVDRSGRCPGLHRPEQTLDHGPVSLSVCILTRDEEDDLPRCLASVAGLAQQLVVVDSGSTDRTLDLAREAGAEIVEQPWLGFVGQRQVALDHARCPWVLCLDADEWLDAALREAVAAVVAAPPGEEPAGYELNRRVHYLGDWIDHGGWSPEWRLRLVRRDRAASAGVEPHDHMRVDGTVARLPGRLNHRPYRDLAEHLAKVDAYAAAAAARRLASGTRPSLARLLLRPPGRLLRMAVLRGGLLDGWRGLVIAVVGGFYVFLKEAKLFEATRGRRSPPGPGGG